MISGKRVGVVIPAAGSGRRMGGVAKQFLEIGGKPLIWYCLSTFQQSEAVDRIAVAGPADGLEQLRTIVREFGFSKVTAVVEGGAERQDSVWNGIQALQLDEVDLIAVHDAARPLLQAADLHRVLEAAVGSDGAILALPASDTVKLAIPGPRIARTVDRETVWLAQTPQVFQREILLKAYIHARNSGIRGTDESALVEAIGGEIALVQGVPSNSKITTAADITRMEMELRFRAQGA